eukprot:TRINITY_DN4758_c0_g1_i1.p1 TRINITY_DN4758_c0_g1~~TRINITY_DN4758_c0_g1_i1.p1  ORF type:complete len:138 (+),score=20.51 TRINITY_DN4758_c0_g1_i1:198-611(+)
MGLGGRLKEVLSKYGKVGFGVHMSVSALSITTLYVAIKNNVNVEALLSKIGIHTPHEQWEEGSTDVNATGGEEEETLDHKSARKGEFLASGGGALALAILCNKALFPVRVPITMALTPPVARFLARRRLAKNGAPRI